MADLVARPDGAASSTPAQRLAELHQQCDEDFVKGEQERANALAFPPYTPFATDAALPLAPEPTDLDVAIGVAQQIIDSDQVTSLREALRLLLRALGAEPDQTTVQAVNGR